LNIIIAMFNRTKDVDVASEQNAYGRDYETGSNDVEPTEVTTIDPDSGVKRGLKNRHLSMMALAGIIGPGLLVGSGGALNSGGPASLIIGFGVIGMCLR
jgi:yeast amino acid transporter